MTSPAPASTRSSVARLRRGMAVLFFGAGCALSFAQDQKPDAGVVPAPPAASRNLTSKGGAWFLVQVKPVKGGPVDKPAILKVQKCLTARLSSRRSSIALEGPDLLYVEVPGLKAEDLPVTKSTIEKPGHLSFCLLSPEGLEGKNPGDGKTIKPGFQNLRYLDDDGKKAGGEGDSKPPAPTCLWVENKPQLSGKCVKYAGAALNPGAIDYMIQVVLHPEAGEKMRAISKANLAKPLAIVVDDEIVSAPTIQSEFGSDFQITGRFTEAQAATLASQLANPLENPVVVVNSGSLPLPEPPKKP